MDADVPLFHGLLKFHHKLLHTIEKIQRRCNNCRIKTVIEDVEKKKDVLFVNLSFDGRKHGKKKRWGTNSQLGISEKGKTKVHTRRFGETFYYSTEKIIIINLLI